MVAKRLTSILGLGLAVTLGSAFATTYSYTTSGCFSNPTAPAAGTSASAVCNGTGSMFSFNDLGGGTETLTYTDASMSNVSAGAINLGTFSFASSGSGSGNVYYGNFTLTLNFSAPTGTTGTPFSAVFSGNQNGTVGGSTISFNPQTESYSSSAGPFTVKLLTDPVQVSTTNPSFTLMATLTTVPEPITVGLFGGGLALIGVLRLRRRSQSR